ncbi:MAG: hypothetical protein U0414_13070 [Polyangiaceae bacterium]
MRSLALVLTSFAAAACASPSVPPSGASVTGPSASPTSSVPPPPTSSTSPVLAEVSCRADNECAVTNSAGCCSCCPCTKLHAISIAELKHREDVCAVIDCEMRCDKLTEPCPRCANPADEGMSARCIDGLCTLVER